MLIDTTQRFGIHFLGCCCCCSILNITSIHALPKQPKLAASNGAFSAWLSWLHWGRASASASHWPYDPARHCRNDSSPPRTFWLKCLSLTGRSFSGALKTPLKFLFPSPPFFLWVFQVEFWWPIYLFIRFAPYCSSKVALVCCRLYLMASASR